LGLCYLLKSHNYCAIIIIFIIVVVINQKHAELLCLEKMELLYPYLLELLFKLAIGSKSLHTSAGHSYPVNMSDVKHDWEDMLFIVAYTDFPELFLTPHR
jgi:hypothetical protein